MARLRQRCDALVTALEGILEGTLFKVSMARFSMIECAVISLNDEATAKANGAPR